MRRLLRGFAWLAAIAIVAVAVAWWAAQPAVPDAFYATPATVPAAPGVLLREAPFERGVPADARAWRILYTTTFADGRPGTASAIVMTSRNDTDGPRPVLAWAHGTTGAVPGCGPSQLDEPFAHVPALASAIVQGWVFVGTDYAGQGTPGPNPYLVGEGEARSVLDAVRAARQLPGLRVDGRTVVWGHSQGGHAALWTGIVAPRYAPDVPLAGVAALAPASDLRPLLDRAQHTPVGRIMSSFVLHAYRANYPDVTPEAYVAAWVRPLAADMGTRCLAGRKALFSVAEAFVLGGTLFRAPPTEGALGARLRENTPDHPLPQPLLVAQGLADELVLPAVQAQFVRRRCAAGQALEYRQYAAEDHLSVVAAASPLVPDLVRWTQARFAGEAPPAGCSGVP